MQRHILMALIFCVTSCAIVEKDNYRTSNSGINIFGGEYEEIESIQELDKSIVSLFEHIERHNGIAEIDAEFTVGCIVKDDVPLRRLVRAGKIGDITFVHYEAGGNGLGLHLLAVKIINGEIVSWQFLDPNKIWYVHEITRAVPETPKCDEKNEFQYTEAYALGFCKKQKGT